MRTLTGAALGLGALMTATLAAAAPAQAADVNLRLAHVAPPTSSFQVAAESYAAHLKDVSGGTMDMSIVPGGALGNIPELWAQLRAGALDMYLMDVGGILANEEGRHFFILFAPYLFKDQDHWRDFMASPQFAEMMQRAEEGMGIKYLGYLKDRSPRALTTARTAVSTPADIQGLKVRTPLVPAITETFKAWGANPTPVAASELYSAMQSGMVDGQDNGITDVVAAGYTEVQNYFMPLDYLRSGIGIWMSGRAWDGLTEEQQQWALEAAERTFAEQKPLFEQEEAEALAEAIAKGMTVVEPDREAFAAASAPVIQALDGKAWPEGLYDQIHSMK